MPGLTRVQKKLAKKMSGAGFPLARHDVIQEKPLGRVLSPEYELIFNRGLDGRSSNFCIFAVKEKDGSLTLDYFNPDPEGLWLKRKDFLVKARLGKDASDQEISDAVNRIAEDSRKKPTSSFHFVSHSHYGRFSMPYFSSSGERIRPGMVDHDDGVSALTDNIRKALFYQIDFHSLTSHNSFSAKAFSFMSWAGRFLGFSPVPGIEFTAPLREPNGPHFLVWMRNSNVARQVKRAIIDRGRRLEMPAYFSGMSMFEILDVLYRFREANLAALGIAHPVNFNSPSLPIPMVGLYTAVETGALELREAHDIARNFDSVAMWNASLCTTAKEVPVENRELKMFLRHLNKKHIGNKRLWVNQSNYSLSRELHDRYNLFTHFETDEHKTLPFLRDFRNGGYVLGGDSLCSGATVIEVPEELISRYGRRPTSSDLVYMLRKKAVKMYGRVFAVKRKEAMTVYSERCEIPDELRGIARHYSNTVNLRYFGMVARDFFDFLGEGKTYQIRNMPGG
ncbi:hypothetical protein GF318_05985 [Candidatus Micrarchaeota archaeon]|nr:hypothetical protein [Candidatus Micrarchaeota archaeon]